jgi:hypothetical protein
MEALPVELVGLPPILSWSPRGEDITCPQPNRCTNFPLVHILLGGNKSLMGPRVVLEWVNKCTQVLTLLMAIRCHLRRQVSVMLLLKISRDLHQATTTDRAPDVDVPPLRMNVIGLVTEPVQVTGALHLAVTATSTTA